MSANPYSPHLLVLPEDDANRQIAVEFRLELADVRRMRVLPVARGWPRAVESLHKDHVREMDRNLNRHLLLLIDFDGDLDRPRSIMDQIPESVKSRIYILGSLNEPEDLRLKLGSFTQIGRDLALDCRDGTNKIWGDALLQHNAAELQRLRQNVHPFLFP